MLPDLRIVIAAVVSTFLLTVGAGFILSSRLMHEQIAARDAQGMHDAPINRIALSWPEPNRFEPAFNLEAAISARSAAARSPVRDITIETAAQEASQALTIPAMTPSAAVATDAPATELRTEPANVVHEPAEDTPRHAEAQDDTQDDAQENTQDDAQAREDGSVPTKDAARTEDSVAGQNQTAVAAEPESTGTIAATVSTDATANPDDAPAPILLAPLSPAADAQDQIQDQVLEEAQKLAAHPAMPDATAAQAEKPAAGEPAKNDKAIRKKRAARKKAAARRPAAQPVQPASQSFDLFGLRAAAAARQAAQTQPTLGKPATR